MLSFENLKIGDRVELPVFPESKILVGKVIHIQGNKFFLAEFITKSGFTVRECFPFYGPVTPRHEKGKGDSTESL